MKQIASNFSSFEILVQQLPIELQERIDQLKNIDQRRDYHPEGDVYQHTKIVTERLMKTRDCDLILAGVFHDIGKDKTTKPHPIHGYPTSPGHEFISAELVNDYHNCIKELGGNSQYVHQIVYYHMRIKQYLSGQLKKVHKREKIEGLATFSHLKVFSIADNMLLSTEQFESALNGTTL